MFVSLLNLRDFRNYENSLFNFIPGTNLILGSNGQGKTNLIEAITYLSTLSSHRVSNDKPLILQGKEKAIVKARLKNYDREIGVDLHINSEGSNKAYINGNNVSLKDLSRNISVILFSPEDIAIVKGEPGNRRKFIDQLIVQKNPRFAALFSDYDRTLRQRNTLLKSMKFSKSTDSTLSVWNDRLINFGAKIIYARIELILLLEPLINDAYIGIAGKAKKISVNVDFSIFTEKQKENHFSLDLISLEKIHENFAYNLEKILPLERERGITLIGPHRDDIIFNLGDLPSRGYASHGESWSLALSLKLAAANILRNYSMVGDPVIILDDVFAELDEKRRVKLSEKIQNYDQVLITAAVQTDLPISLNARTIKISAGKIVSEDD